MLLGSSIFYPCKGMHDQIFKKPIRPGKDDCLTHKSPGIESLSIWFFKKNDIWKKNLSPTPKKVIAQIYPLEKIIIKGSFFYENLFRFDFLVKAEFPNHQLVTNLLQIKLQLKSCWLLNRPTLYLSIIYKCDSKLNCQSTSNIMTLSVCHLLAC